MKIKLLALPLALMLMTFSSMLHAQEWATLNDDFSINYSKQIVKMFIVSKSDTRGSIQQEARQKMYGFIGNLNVEDSDKKLKAVFSARQMLDAKVQAAISENMQHLGSSPAGSNGYLHTFTLDLNNIKSIVPELEMPSASK